MTDQNPGDRAAQGTPAEPRGGETGSDPIERIRKHLEFHKDSERAMFSTAGLRALLSKHDRSLLSVEYWRRLAMQKDGEIIALTQERDELIVEKSQSSWGEFQRQAKMLADATRQRDELKAEVDRLLAHANYVRGLEQQRDEARRQRDELKVQNERLLAKEAERIGKALVERRPVDGDEPSAGGK